MCRCGEGGVGAAYIFTWMQLKHVTSGSQYDLNIYSVYPLYACVWHGLSSLLFKRLWNLGSFEEVKIHVQSELVSRNPMLGVKEKSGI